MGSSVHAFLIVSIVVIATPGPDTALTIRNVVAGGRRAGLATALGVAAGQLIWAIATSLGLVGLLLASEPVFHALRLVGAAYLVYLGAQSLRSSFKAVGDFDQSGSGTSGPLQPCRAFVQGILNDLANPKMAIFFVSVLPQFAQPEQGMLSQLVVLGVLFATLTFIWLSSYSILLGVAGEWLQRSPVRRTIEGIAGAALIGLGIRVATVER